MKNSTERHSLNIVMISFAWSQEDRGGLGQHVYELASSLRRRGNDVSVICIDNSQDRPAYETNNRTEEGIKIFEIAYQYQDAQSFYDMQAPYRITQKIKHLVNKINPHIVHIHHCLFTGFKIVEELAKNYIVIHTFHDYYAITPRGQLLDQQQKGIKKISSKEWERQATITWPAFSRKNDCNQPDQSRNYTSEIKDNKQESFSPMNGWVEYNKYCLSHCTSLICPSQGAAEILRLNGINLPLKILENGINKEELNENLKRETITVKAKIFKVLILGSVTPSKGQLVFCESIIKANLLDKVEVHMFGPTPETYHGEEVQQNKIRDICKQYPSNFQLKGSYKHEDLNNILSQYDIAAIPSTWEEVFGLVAREGLCYGLPVICTDVGGLKGLKGKPNVYTLKILEINKWPDILAKEFRRGQIKKLIQYRRQKLLKNTDFIKSTENYVDDIYRIYTKDLNKKIIKKKTRKENKQISSILFFAPAHGSQAFGGTENAATSLYNYFRFENENTSAWLATSSEPQPYDDNQIEIDRQQISLQCTAKNPDLRNKKLKELAKTIQPQIIHFQHFTNIGIDAIQAIRSIWPKAKIVLTAHEYLLICANDGQMIKKMSSKVCTTRSPEECAKCFKQTEVKEFETRDMTMQLALNSCDGLITPSHWLLDQIKKNFLIPKNHTVIENGLATQLIDQAKFLADHKQINTYSCNRFAFFGRTCERKGLLLILQACYKLSLSHQGLFRLEIYGGGLKQEPASIQHRVNALLKACKDHVVMKGHYHQNEIPQLMQRCDWVIVPSIWWENSPVVIQEAFACQKPIIGSGHGGIAEKIKGQGGITFKPNNVEDLTIQLSNSIGNSTLHNRLREEIKRPYAVEQCGEKHVEFYKELLSDGV